MSYVCIQGNRRFQCLSNYLSNDQSLLCSCSKSKQWSLVTWGKTGTCSETDDENKYKAPLDAFQVWLHDKMLWLQHFITSYILIFCIIVISFAFFFFFGFWVLTSFGEKKINIYVQFSIAVGYFILEFRDWWFDMKSIFLWIKAAGYLQTLWKNNLFLKQSRYIIFYHILFYHNRLKLNIHQHLISHLWLMDWMC